MARDNDTKNGFSIRAPQSIYDAGYVKTNGLAKKSGDVTGLGWRPKLPIPETYSYFGRIGGRKNAPAETEAMRTLGNQWRRK